MEEEGRRAGEGRHSTPEREVGVFSWRLKMMLSTVQLPLGEGGMDVKGIVLQPIQDKEDIMPKPPSCPYLFGSGKPHEEEHRCDLLNHHNHYLSFGAAKEPGFL